MTWSAELAAAMETEADLWHPGVTCYVCDQPIATAQEATSIRIGKIASPPRLIHAENCPAQLITRLLSRVERYGRL